MIARILLLLIIFFFYIMAGVGIYFKAHGQEIPRTGHVTDNSQFHIEFYKTWLMPNSRNAEGQRTSSCCNDLDCYPTSIQFMKGAWYALRREDQKWIKLPPHLLEEEQPDPRESPDMSSHVCMSAPLFDGSSNVYCAVRGAAY